MRAILDLETGLPEGWTPPPMTEADRNAGIQDRWGDEAKQRHQAHNIAYWAETARKKACLDWRLGRITMIGLLTPVTDPMRAMAHDVTICHANDERELLTRFWREVRGFDIRHFVGFGIRNMDIPWLLGRSSLLGVATGLKRPITMPRYGGGDVTDWADILSNFGSFDTRGWTLDRYAALYDLPERPIGKGEDMPRLYAEGKIEEIRAHLVADLRTTHALDQRLRSVYLGG